MILRKEEGRYGEGKAQRSGDHRGVEAVGSRSDGRTFRLKPGEVFTIPAGVIHRTRSHARAVNLCFEDRNAYTNVVFS